MHYPLQKRCLFGTYCTAQLEEMLNGDCAHPGQQEFGALSKDSLQNEYIVHRLQIAVVAHAGGGKRERRC